MVLAGTLLLGLAMPAGSSAVDPDPNPWFTKQFLNIAHQGGEDEAPSETMFAMKSAIDPRGADMLEIDVNLTSDGELVVIHNDTVNRTTESTRARADNPSSMVRALTLNQIQALDAGYTFTSEGGYSKDPAKTYPYRGIRTGDKAPPAGYTAEDFKIPTLREVLDTFPTTPINIEIKMEKHQMAGPPGSGCEEPNNATGYCDDEAESEDIAVALAALLSEDAYDDRTDIIVVSFSDHLMEVFAPLAPHVALAPGQDDIVAYTASGGAVTPTPDVAAFQVPPSFNPFSDVPGLLKPFTDADGYAMHVWPNGPEGDTEPEYQRFLDLGVQGYMASKPGRLHAYLCAKEVPRPDGSDRCPPAKKKCGKKSKKKRERRAGLIRADKKKCKKKKRKGKDKTQAS